MRCRADSATLGVVDDARRTTWDVPTRPPAPGASSPTRPAVPLRTPNGAAGRDTHRIAVVLALLVGSVAMGVLGAALVFASPGVRAEQLSRQEEIDLFARAQISTVRVAARACPGVIHGSGFVIDGLLFTSGHIAANDQRLKVDRPGQPVETPVMATSVSLDVAIADASRLAAVEMVLGRGRVPEGETVFIAGFPDGGELETSPGRIVAYADAVEWGVQGRHVMLIEPGIRAGFSGGPVVDRDGELVGMLSGVDSATGLAVAIPGDELAAVVHLAFQTWSQVDRTSNRSGSVAHVARSCGG